MERGTDAIVDSDEDDPVPIDTEAPRRTIASCEWLSLVTDFRPLEIDRIAWWIYTDPEQRDAAIAAQQPRSP